MKKLLQGVALAAFCAIVSGQALAEDQPTGEQNAPSSQATSQNDMNSTAPAAETTQAPAAPAQ